MRIFICFEGSSEPIDVPSDQTVGAVKHMIKVIKSYNHVQGVTNHRLFFLDILRQGKKTV